MNAPAHFYDWPLHVLMAHNLTAGSAVSIVGSFWSLALEFQLYLLFPLLLLLVRKSGLRGALLVTIAVSLAWSVVCLCRVGPHPAAFGTTVAWYYAVPGRAVEFTFGIAAAACISRPRQAQTRISIVLSFVFILATLLLYTGFADQSSLAHSFIGSVHLSLWGLKSVFAGVGFAALLVALQPFDERIHRSKLLGPLTAFGTISFSAYLLQEPLLRYTAPTLTRFQGAGALTEPRFWLITVLWILLILVPLTRMYHIFAERPFLRGAPKWLKLPKKVESVTASIPS
jgi:peptidoglycan/LPS O-acetylase OafA/YrhL